MSGSSEGNRTHPPPVAEIVHHADDEPAVIDQPELIDDIPPTTTTTDVVRTRRRWPAILGVAAIAAAGIAVTSTGDTPEPSTNEPTSTTTTPTVAAAPAATSDDPLPERRAVLDDETDVLGQTVRLRVSPTNGRLPQLVSIAPDGLTTVEALPPPSRFELDPTGVAAELDERGLLTVGPDGRPVDVEVMSFAWHAELPGRLAYLTANRSDGVDLVVAGVEDGDVISRTTIAAGIDPSLGGLAVAAQGDLGFVLAFETFRTVLVLSPEGADLARLDADLIGTFGDSWLLSEWTGERFAFDPATGDTTTDLGPWDDGDVIVRRSVRSPDGARTAIHTLRGAGVDAPDAVSEIHIVDHSGDPVVPPLSDVRGDTPLRWRADGSVLAFTPSLDGDRHRIGLFRPSDGATSVFAAPEVDLGPPVGSAPVRTDLGVIVIDSRQLITVRVTDVLP